MCCRSLSSDPPPPRTASVGPTRMEGIDVSPEPLGPPLLPVSCGLARAVTQLQALPVWREAGPPLPGQMQPHKPPSSPRALGALCLEPAARHTCAVPFIRWLHYLNLVLLNSKMGTKITSLLWSCFRCPVICQPITCGRLKSRSRKGRAVWHLQGLGQTLLAASPG